MADVNPFCPKSESGFHCGHEIHRHAPLIGSDPRSTRLTAKCCWCDELIEMNFSVVKIAIVGHGMGLTQPVEVWDLPVEWQKGD